MKLISTQRAVSFSCKAQKLKQFTWACYSLILIFILLTGIRGNAQPAVPNYPSLTFNSAVLISGNEGEINATYLFPAVMPGVDAHVTIMALGGGARLVEIDNTTGAGYYDAFQPYVAAAPNDTSYIDWKIVFKKANTSDDTTLAVLAVTGIDVDGDGSSLKEFIQAATPGSFALEPGTFLNFSFDGIRSTAISTIDNFPLIDTAQRKAMFQMNFSNINTILYRNGAVSTYGAEQIRQTSIYFKSFFNVSSLLPVKLISFDARATGNSNVISWKATNEEDLNYYSVQKSTDGNNWTEIKKVIPKTINDVNSYEITDNATSITTLYYRLQQKNFKGMATYSKTIKIKSMINGAAAKITSGMISINKVNVNVNTPHNDEYHINIYALSGVKVGESRAKVYTGTNRFSLDLPATAAKGLYVIVINDNEGQLIYNARINSL